MKLDSQLVVESDQILLREIWVELNLIENWLVSSISEEIKKHGDCAVADTNVLNKTLIDESFHLSPNLMSRGILNGTLIFPHHLGSHPMDQIQIKVLKLESLELISNSTFNIVSLSLP